MAQNEVPFDFRIFTYIIAVDLGQLWEIFRCFRGPTASGDTENMSRGCNKLFGSFPEGFGWNPWRRKKLGSSFYIDKNKFFAIWGTKKIGKCFCVFFRSCGRYKVSIKKIRFVAFFSDFIELRTQTHTHTHTHTYIYIYIYIYIGCKSVPGGTPLRFLKKLAPGPEPLYKYMLKSEKLKLQKFCESFP